MHRQAPADLYRFSSLWRCATLQTVYSRIEVEPLPLPLTKMPISADVVMSAPTPERPGNLALVTARNPVADCKSGRIYLNLL